MKFIMKETVMCVRCVKRKAVIHGGYVILPNGNKVLAGWCNYCCKKYIAFSGHFRASMRLRSSSYE